MDIQAELAWERSALAKADADLQEGGLRRDAQELLVSHLRTRSRETESAEHLLDLLRQTMILWEQHRELILQRIAYLEGKIAGVVPVPAISTGPVRR